MQKVVNFNNTATFYFKGCAYRIYFWYMSKDDAINITNYNNMIDKLGNFSFYYI